MRGADGGLRRERRCSSDVRESALSSWHTARDRAMTRTIVRTLGGRTERSGAERSGAARPSVRRRIESAFIWRACTREYAEGREREREGEVIITALVECEHQEER